MRVPSSDRVSVTVHEFGGAGRPLLLSHATGFHGYCYLPMADALDSEFTAFSIDYRGHGDTARPDGWAVDWSGYGDDATAVARALAPDGGLVGFGHSMGGTALLMAAHRDHALFDVIILYEPPLFQPDVERPRGDPGLADGARRRRSTFGSFDEAIANYGSKPPMMSFHPDALRLYVAHGFRPSPEGVRLKCDPEHEAATFESTPQSGAWDLLPDIHTRVVVVAGSVDAFGPGRAAAAIADRLPNSSYLQFDDLDHFGPFTDPVRVAGLIRDATNQHIGVAHRGPAATPPS